MNCNCDKCGGGICPECGHAKCEGGESCVRFQIEALREQIADLQKQVSFKPWNQYGETLIVSNDDPTLRLRRFDVQTVPIIVKVPYAGTEVTSEFAGWATIGGSI